MFKTQTELVVIHASDLELQEDLGEQILRYMDSPDVVARRRLEFAASNFVARFPINVRACDEQWPYLRLRTRLKQRIDRPETFLSEWRSTGLTNSLTEGQQ